MTKTEVKELVKASVLCKIKDWLETHPMKLKHLSEIKFITKI
mgnify:CR=1 FL=1